MKISELSPDLRPTSGDPQPLRLVLDELESLVREIESLSSDDLSSLATLAAGIRRYLSRLSSSGPLPDSAKLLLWKFAFRLWNACVDLSNAASLLPFSSDDDRRRRIDNAEIRHAAADILLLAGTPAGVPSASLKSASFFHRTGLIWHDLGRLDLAAGCFERATDLVSGAGRIAGDEDERRRLVLDLNLARSRTAWEASDRILAVALLNRSKTLVAGSPAMFPALAEQYLQFGKLELSKKPSDDALNASDLLAEALDLCEKGIAAASGGSAAEALALRNLKERCLRFMAAERLQADDYEGVLRCVRVLRAASVAKKEGEHPSVGYVALRAWIGAGRIAEAEKELKALVANREAAEGVIVSAAEAYLAAAPSEAAREVVAALAGRCRAGAAAAVRLVKRVIDGGGGAGRARAVAELASDERVVSVFDVAPNERNAMHALLWNSGAEHFRSKNYEISGELFERSLLYVPRDEENRSRRSNCFRVLALCHLALSQLDRAQEFIDQANKLEPNIKCAFLKFKIHLQKKDEREAIKQMQAMVNCIDFNPEFLTLSAHEAMACKSTPVAIASLLALLNLYFPGNAMPMPEVAVLRNLITLLHRSPEPELEILKYTKRARVRMVELGAESFFGKGAVGSRELNWFAGNSWNMGLKTGKEKKYELCAEFLELAAEFYELAASEDNEANQSIVCKSLIMSVACMLNVEEQKAAPLPDSDIKKANDMLTRASKILPSISSSALVVSDQTVENSTLLFVHTYFSYQLLNRVDANSHTPQLQLIKSYAASKACTPDHLLQLGLTASQGARPNLDVAEFALKACLSSLLTSPSPEYKLISIALRKLACLAGFHDTDGGKNDPAYDVYKQAQQIIVGLKDGEYPVEEGKWLAMTAWNKSGLAIHLRQTSIARKWMKMGLDLARHLKGMEQYRVGMEECFAKFEKLCGGQGREIEGGSCKSQPVLV
ncbi:TPR repeat-containing protein ZIP4 [Typha angustifolia]|uniref:TPR repeat-containing protein ZIP4 n=1 Tax=Typha angustifolia TaxID=59011 RepID=UPI003C30C298